MNRSKRLSSFPQILLCYLWVQAIYLWLTLSIPFLPKRPLAVLLHCFPWLLALLMGRCSHWGQTEALSTWCKTFRDDGAFFCCFCCCRHISLWLYLYFFTFSSLRPLKAVSGYFSVSSKVFQPPWILSTFILVSFNPKSNWRNRGNILYMLELYLIF